MLKAPNCLDGFFMVLIKSSFFFFSVSDLLTAFFLCLSWNPFLWSLCKPNCYHCYSFGPLLSAVQHTALWELVEPLWSRFPERTTYKLRNLCPHNENATVLSLLSFLPPTCSPPPLLSLSPSFSFLATGSGGRRGFSTCHDIPPPPNPWSRLYILFFEVDYHKYFIRVVGS